MCVRSVMFLLSRVFFESPSQGLTNSMASVVGEQFSTRYPQVIPSFSTKGCFRLKYIVDSNELT